MKRILLILLVPVILLGCATGPVYHVKPWEASVKAAISRVSSYVIGKTTEDSFRADWIPKREDVPAYSWALACGRIVGHLDSNTYRTAGHSTTVHWLGYNYSSPYTTHMSETRLYALRFTDRVLVSVYDP